MGALGVEPEDPFCGADLDVVDVAPGALATDQLVLERPDGGLGHRVVQGVAHGPDRRVDAFVEQPLVNAYDVY